MIDKDKFIIVSGADKNRFDAETNHKNYCLHHSFNYKFNYKDNLPIPYFIKCYTILEAFENYEYVLWVDDDVFFLDHSWDARIIFQKYNNDIVVTRGKSKKSGITLFNNGIIYLKNTSTTRTLIQSMIDVTLEEVKQNYKESWGPMDELDQSRMIYLSQKMCPKKVTIVPYPGFNAHESDFKKKDYLERNPPFVHITGPKKHEKIKRFYENTGIKLP